MHGCLHFAVLLALQLHPVHLQGDVDYQCEYLVAHKDLVCQCTRYTMTISSLSSLIAKFPGTIESVKLHLCQSVDISISTVDIQQPFYQIRIEDIDHVTLRGVQLGHGHALDILIRNVRGGLYIIDRLGCADCAGLVRNTTSDIRLTVEPNLSLQVKDTTQVNIQYVDITSVNFRFKTRNVGNIKIVNCKVDKIAKNAVELFYSQQLEISYSIFKQVDEKAVTLNHVDRVDVTHTLGFNNKTLNFLSNETQVAFSCTASYDGTLEHLYSWEEEECGAVSLLHYHGEEEGTGGNAAVGAAILTVSCVVVILVVTLVVILMHKKGRLAGWL